MVLYDSHVTIRSDFAKLFQCAGQNRILAAAGQTNKPLANGFMAVRPSKQLLNAALLFASDERWSETDWTTYGFGANECAPGLLWSMFWAADAHGDAIRAMREAGSQTPTSMLINRCEWNWMPHDDIYCSAASCDRAHAVHHGSNC